MREADPPLQLSLLWENPPVTVSTSGQIWSRGCERCNYRLYSQTGPILLGTHLCQRDGVMHLVHWAQDLRLDAVKAFELKRLASMNPRDEWHAADLYDQLAAAVLNALGGGVGNDLAPGPVARAATPEAPPPVAP